MKRTELRSDLEKRRAFLDRGRRSSALSLNGSRSRLRRRQRSAWGGLREQKQEQACRNCGAHRGSSAVIELHHAVPRSLSRRGRDDLRNGLPLCRSCHNAWHSGTPIFRDVFTAEEWAFIEQIAPSIGWLARHYPRPTHWRMRAAA